MCRSICSAGVQVESRVPLQSVVYRRSVPLPLLQKRFDRSGSPDGAAAARNLSRNKRRVALVDPWTLARDCLLQELMEHCSDLTFIGTDTVESISSVEADQPDLVIFATHKPAITDVDRQQLAIVQSRSIATILIVERRSVSQAIDALSEGLCGVFSEEDNIELLLAAIRLVLAGGRFVPSSERNRPPLP